MEMGTAVTTRQLSVDVGTHKVVVVARSQTLALRGRSWILNTFVLHQESSN